MLSLINVIDRSNYHVHADITNKLFNSFDVMYIQDFDKSVLTEWLQELKKSRWFDNERIDSIDMSDDAIITTANHFGYAIETPLYWDSEFDYFTSLKHDKDNHEDMIEEIDLLPEDVPEGTRGLEKYKKEYAEFIPGVDNVQARFNRLLEMAYNFYFYKHLHYSNIPVCRKDTERFKDNDSIFPSPGSLSCHMLDDAITLALDGYKTDWPPECDEGPIFRENINMIVDEMKKVEGYDCFFKDDFLECFTKNRYAFGDYEEYGYDDCHPEVFICDFKKARDVFFDFLPRVMDLDIGSLFHRYLEDNIGSIFYKMIREMDDNLHLYFGGCEATENEIIIFVKDDWY